MKGAQVNELLYVLLVNSFPPNNACLAVVRLFSSLTSLSFEGTSSLVPCACSSHCFSKALVERGGEGRGREGRKGEGEGMVETCR